MKRLLIAVALLAAVITACVWTTRTLQRNTDYLIQSLDEMQTAFEKGDIDSARRQAEHFAAEFPRRTRTFSFFLQHGDIIQIEEIAASLPVMLKTGDENHFPSEIARCRLQLEKLNDLELPLWENIL